MTDKSKDIKRKGGLPEPPPEIMVAPEVEEHAEAPEKSPKAIIIGIIISIAIGLGIALLPTPQGLSPEGHKFLALLTTVIILWIAEAIPVGVTGLIVGGGLSFLRFSLLQRHGRLMQALRLCLFL